MQHFAMHGICRKKTMVFRVFFFTLYSGDRFESIDQTVDILCISATIPTRNCASILKCVNRDTRNRDNHEVGCTVLPRHLVSKCVCVGMNK